MSRRDASLTLFTWFVLLSAFAPVSAGADTGRSRLIFTTNEPSRYLTDDEIKQQIVGHNFAGHYNTGKTWAEDYDATGSLRYREPNIDITGYWTLSDGVFCTFYRQQLGGGCWRVVRTNRNCYEFYGASQGPGPTTTDKTWTARGWKTKEAPGCGAPQIS